jgi:hypothetical protein
LQLLRSAVGHGLAHRCLDQVTALEQEHQRKQEAAGVKEGTSFLGGIAVVCTGICKAYLNVIAKRLPEAISILDRFHTMQHFSRAIDQQVPRYPLTLAELDPERICTVRDSVSVIQDLPPGAPSGGPSKKGDLGRRYTNFGLYLDRETNEFVLSVAEVPRISSDDWEGDCVRFRIRMGGYAIGYRGNE